MENDNKLVIIVKETGLGNPQADLIVSKFMPLFQDAIKLIEESNSIVVSDVGQVEEMAKARSNRLLLKDIRVMADKTRKVLKEDVIKYGDAVQGVYNLIKDAIEPVEEYLEKQEKFAEIIEKEKAKLIKEKRTNEMLKYVEDVSVYNFDTMTDEAFANLLSGVKIVWEKKQAELKKEEDERISAQKKKEEEDEKMRIENAKMKKYKEIAEKKEEDERKKREIEQKKKDDEHQKELEKERAEKKKIEDELKKKEEDERKKREADKKIEEEKLEKERQAKLAPEKDKLTEYAEIIRTIKSPEGLSKAGLEVVKTVESKLLAISQEIKLKIKEL